MCQLAELATERVEFLLNFGRVLDLQSQGFIDVLNTSLQDEDFFVFALIPGLPWGPVLPTPSSPVLPDRPRRPSMPR